MLQTHLVRRVATRCRVNMPFGNLKLNDGNEVGSSITTHVSLIWESSVHLSQIPAIAFGTGSKWYEKVGKEKLKLYLKSRSNSNCGILHWLGCANIRRAGIRERLLPYRHSAKFVIRARLLYVTIKLRTFLSVYKNEDSVGDAVREAGLKREELYITTKYGGGVIRESFETSLKKVSHRSLSRSISIVVLTRGDIA